MKAGQALDTNANSGALAIGVMGGVGVGVTYVAVDADVAAYIAPGTSVAGWSTTERVNVAVDGRLTHIADTVGVAGGGGYFGAGAAALAFQRDTSSARAYIGAAPTKDGDAAVAEGVSSFPSAPKAAELTSVGSVSVTSDASTKTKALVGGIAVGGVVAVGAAIVDIDVQTNSLARVGRDTQIGTNDARSASLTVAAGRAVEVKPKEVFRIGDTDFTTMGVVLAASGGAALTGGAITINVGGETSASIGRSADVFSSGAASVSATSTVDATGIRLDGLAAGLLAAGGQWLKVEVAPKTTASIEAGAQIFASSISVTTKAVVNVSATNVATSVGLGAGAGFNTDVIVRPTTRIEIGTGAGLDASGNILLQSISSIDASGAADVGAYGGVSVVKGDISGVVGSVNRIDIGSGATIDARGTFTAIADTTNKASIKGESAGGAVLPFSYANPSITSTDTTLVAVAALALVSATGAVRLDARARHDLYARGEVDMGGLGGEASGRSTIDHTGTAQVRVDEPASASAGQTRIVSRQGDVELLARIAGLNILSDMESDGAAVGAKLIATAKATVNSTATVDLGGRNNAGNTSPTGKDILIKGANVTLRAAHEWVAPPDQPNMTPWNAVSTSTKADASFLGGAGTVSAYSENTSNVKNLVTTLLDSEIEAVNLKVAAEGPSSPSISATASRSVAIEATTGGDRKTDTKADFDRIIDFSSTVRLSGGLDPSITIRNPVNNAFGAPYVVEAVGVSAPTMVNGVWMIPDIAYSTTQAGRATFITTSTGADGGYGQANERSLKGTPKISANDGFNSITITNLSDASMQLGRIVASAPGVNAADLISTGAAGLKTQFINSQSVSPVETKITVLQAGAFGTGYRDVILGGPIEAPNGTVAISIATPAGSILGGSSEADAVNAVIRAKSADLVSRNGWVGNDKRAIMTDVGSLLVDAGAKAVVTAVNDLKLRTLSVTGLEKTSPTGPIAGVAVISAGGSILAASGTGDGVSMIASDITLSAAGRIGSSSADPLKIRADKLTATATRGIAVDDQRGALELGQLIAISGDILVRTTDTATSGEDIVLTAATNVRALAGSVSLESADDIHVVADARIVAAGAIALRGDTRKADDLAFGATITLSGLVSGSSLEVGGGDGNDTIRIQRLEAGVPLSINGGAGNDTVLIGSAPGPQVRSFRALGERLPSRGAPDRIRFSLMRREYATRQA